MGSADNQQKRNSGRTYLRTYVPTYVRTYVRTMLPNWWMRDCFQIGSHGRLFKYQSGNREIASRLDIMTDRPSTNQAIGFREYPLQLTQTNYLTTAQMNADPTVDSYFVFWGTVRRARYPLTIFSFVRLEARFSSDYVLSVSGDLRIASEVNRREKKRGRE